MLGRRVPSPVPRQPGRGTRGLSRATAGRCFLCCWGRTCQPAQLRLAGASGPRGSGLRWGRWSSPRWLSSRPRPALCRNTLRIC